jgi:mono/diheme cytochrome c family protein
MATGTAFGGLGVVAVLGVMLVAAGSFCVSTAAAQPAASEQSSWTNLPREPSAALVDPLLARGEEVFHARCIACHGEIPEQTFGAPFLPPMPGTQALRARYRGEVPAALEQRTDLTPALIEAVVRKGFNSMPFFRPTELSEGDLEALSAFLTRERD